LIVKYSYCNFIKIINKKFINNSYKYHFLCVDDSRPFYYYNCC